MITIPDVLTDADIHAITQQVWASMLDTEVEPLAPDTRRPAVPVRAGVHIDGPWSGDVRVHVSNELAATITGQMLEMDVAEAALADIIDAVGEIANMIGGNVKALLPGPSTLSLPAVEIDPSADAADQPTGTWQFDVGGERLIVTITASPGTSSPSPHHTHEGTTP